jgi:hypothetical protein
VILQMFEILLATIAIIVIPSIIGYILPTENTKPITRWLLSILFIGTLYTVFHGFGLPKISLIVTIFVLIAIGLYRLIQQRRSKIILKKFSIDSMLIIAVIAVLGLITWSNVLNNLFLEWDAVAIWLSKARDIYNWKEFAGITIVNYPNLGTGLWAYAMDFSSFIDALGRLIFPTVFIALAGGLLEQKIHTIKELRLKVLVSFIVLGLFIFFIHPGVWNGYQDILLGSVAAYSALLLSNSFNSLISLTQKKWDIAVGMALLGSVYLIKNEGLFLILIILFSYLVALIVQKRKRLRYLIKGNRGFVFRSAFILVLPAVLWTLILVTNKIDPGQIQGEAFSIRGVLAIGEKLDHIKPIAKALVVQTWLFLPVILLAMVTTLISFRLRFLRSLNIFFWLVIILHTAFICFAFLATNADITWHIGTAFSRLINQHQLFYILLIVINFVAILELSNRKEEK